MMVTPAVREQQINCVFNHNFQILDRLNIQSVNNKDKLSMKQRQRKSKQINRPKDAEQQKNQNTYKQTHGEIHRSLETEQKNNNNSKIQYKRVHLGCVDRALGQHDLIIGQLAQKIK